MAGVDALCPFAWEGEWGETSLALGEISLSSMKPCARWALGEISRRFRSVNELGTRSVPLFSNERL